MTSRSNVGSLPNEPETRLGDESLGPLIRRGLIGFGCARLHHLSSPSSRERLIRTAIGGGIRILDVAPAYGNGLCERLVGRAVRGSGREVAVNTKVGIPVRIYPPTADVAFPIMRLVDRMMGTHADAYRRRDFSPEMLRTSLEGSLARLGLERVETYFLHEPLETLTSTQWDEVVAQMSRLHEQGKIRSWGIAGPCRSLELAQVQSAVPFVIQQPLDELRERPTPPLSVTRIAYSVFAAFRASGCKAGFGRFLEEEAARYPDARFLVSTIDSKRLTHWLGESRS